jgi:hypothetical protein
VVMVSTEVIFIGKFDTFRESYDMERVVSPSRRRTRDPR